MKINNAPKINNNNKYNNGIEAGRNNSVYLLLNRVERGSLVLEFGPANGRMTKFLRDNLDCKVYIVEYDQTAFADAIQYAEKGICGDILDLEWLEEFKNIQFDYILFADVLEHLTAPDIAIMNAKLLLKPSGSMLVSLPNIAHNDIIYNLLINKFPYTNTGLLDTTHVRFFAYDNLDSFFSTCGFSIIYEDAVILQTHTTEQLYTEKVFDMQLTNSLRSRPLGEVYQFILELKMTEHAQNMHLIKDSNLVRNNRFNCEIFYSDNEQFDEQHVFRFINTFQHGAFSIGLQLPEYTKMIRFDPVNSFGCIIKDFEILVDGYSIPIKKTNGVFMGGYDIFLTSDPQLIAKLPINSMKRIEIRGEYLNPSSSKFNVLLGIARDILHESSKIIEGNFASHRSSVVHPGTVLQQQDTIEQQYRIIESQKAIILQGDLKEKALTESNAQLHAQLEDILHSKAWQITKPLRTIRSWFPAK